MEPFKQVDAVAAPMSVPNVDTDQIIPARFCWRKRGEGWGHLVFHDLRFDDQEKPKPDFVLNRDAYREARILVADRNFGCGSSREQAASCLKGHELTIVARGFARIFLQNAINLGMRVVVAPGIEAAEGDELEIEADEVTNRTSGRSFAVVPLAQARASIVEAGGLVPYTRRRIGECRKKNIHVLE
jgi:3-isopropylmalate/(R)-2-methylmalate dehydratase small subunit